MAAGMYSGLRSGGLTSRVPSVAFTVYGRLGGSCMGLAFSHCASGCDSQFGLLSMSAIERASMSSDMAMQVPGIAEVWRKCKSMRAFQESKTGLGAYCCCQGATVTA